MTGRIMAALLAGGVLLTGWALAQEPPADKDEPPLRLKKKVPPGDAQPDQPKEPKKPATEEKKPDEPGKEPEPAEPAENEKEVLDRVAKNMRSLEERLANKELGGGTHQTGEDILKDIDSLLRSMENPPQGGGDAQNEPSGSSNDQKNQGGKTGQSGSSGQRSPSGGGKRGDKSNQQGGGTQQSGTDRKPGTGGKQSGNQPMGGGQQPGTDPMGKKDPKSGTDPMGGTGTNGKAGNDKQDPLNPNADLYKDTWGHLPEALRAEMNAYSSDKELIPKYDALIKKCSRTIAEQSSRKDKK